jgi:hypothetical protein
VYFDQQRERPNEEDGFGCLGGGNADGSQYSTVIGGLLALLLPLSHSCLGATTPTPNHNSVRLSWPAAWGNLLTKFNAEQGDCLTTPFPLLGRCVG